jgi:hypothetical protein
VIPSVIDQMPSNRRAWIARIWTPAADVPFLFQPDHGESKPLSALVDLAVVADLHHRRHQGALIHPAQDAVIAHAVAPEA